VFFFFFQNARIKFLKINNKQEKQKFLKLNRFLSLVEKRASKGNSIEPSVIPRVEISRIGLLKTIQKAHFVVDGRMPLAEYPFSVMPRAVGLEILPQRNLHLNH